jgi:hypothetical protein
MKKQENPYIPVPANLFFYTISLDNELTITKETLYNHYKHHPTKKHRSPWIRVFCLNYHYDVFTVGVLLANEKTFKIFLHLSKDELHVGCECGMPGEELCYHAYHGLFKLMHYHSMKLERYYWPELTTEHKGEFKFLEVDVNWANIKITPRKEYGNIYKKEFGFLDAEELTFEKQQQPEMSPSKGNQEVLGYALMYIRMNYANTHLPFIMPFIGTTNKAGDGIAFYQHYLRKDKPFTHNLKLTDEQIMLNEISYDMFKLSKSVGKQYNEVNTESWKAAAPIMLNLWRKVIPKLKYEKYVKSCYTWGFKNWHDKPRKSDMHTSKILMDQLSISFVLKDKGEYFNLELLVKAGERNITPHALKIPLFVMDTGTNTFYLVNSMQDENLLNWLSKYNSRLTVMKAHFENFKNRFLSPLSKCYLITNQVGKSKNLYY